MLTAKDGQMKCFCGYNSCCIHFLISTLFNFMGLNTPLKTQWNWYSSSNEQQNIILRGILETTLQNSFSRRELFQVDGQTDRDEKDKRQLVYF
jgi:hypothetical protein